MEDLEMLAILVILFALAFVGIVLFARHHAEAKPALVPVPIESGPQVGDFVRYTDKRTGNYRGRAFITGHRRDGLVTLRHGPNACQFSVHPSRIIE